MRIIDLDFSTIDTNGSSSGSVICLRDTAATCLWVQCTFPEPLLIALSFPCYPLLELIHHYWNTSLTSPII